MMYIAYSLKCIRFYHNAYRQFCFLQGTRLYDLLNTYSLYCISYIFILFSYSLPRLLLFIHFHLCYTYHYYISRKGNTMSNNKKNRKAELEWLSWKEKEEKQPYLRNFQCTGKKADCCANSKTG